MRGVGRTRESYLVRTLNLKIEILRAHPCFTSRPSVTMSMRADDTPHRTRPLLKLRVAWERGESYITVRASSIQLKNASFTSWRLASESSHHACYLHRDADEIALSLMANSSSTSRKKTKSTTRKSLTCTERRKNHVKGNAHGTAGR